MTILWAISPESLSSLVNPVGVRLGRAPQLLLGVADSGAFRILDGPEREGELALPVLPALLLGDEARLAKCGVHKRHNGEYEQKKKGHLCILCTVCTHARSLPQWHHTLWGPTCLWRSEWCCEEVESGFGLALTIKGFFLRSLVFPS